MRDAYCFVRVGRELSRCGRSEEEGGREARNKRSREDHCRRVVVLVAQSIFQKKTVWFLGLAASSAAFRACSAAAASRLAKSSAKDFLFR